MQFARRAFDVLLDLAEREGVGVALVPVGRAVEGMEGEARGPRPLAPVRTLADGNAAHQEPNEEKLLPLPPKPPKLVEPPLPVELLAPVEPVLAATDLILPAEAEPPDPVAIFEPEPVQ